MSGGESDMRCIVRRDRRDDLLAQQPRRQLSHRSCLRQQREAAQLIQARRGKGRITTLHFFEYGGRDVAVVVLTMKIPPIPRRLLIRGELQIPAPPRRELARDSRFEVECWEAQRVGCLRCFFRIRGLLNRY